MRNIRVADPRDRISSDPGPAPAGRRVVDWLATLPILLLLPALLLALLPATAAGPSLRVTPGVLVPGAKATVLGSGFPKGQKGVLAWDQVSTGMPTYRANGKGQFRVNFPVPATKSATSHRVSALVIAPDGAAQEAAFVVVQVAAPPTAVPTAAPTAAPTTAPTAGPTVAPTAAPTTAPTSAPSVAPTAAPTAAPTQAPTPTPPTVPPTCGTTLQSLVNGASAGSTVRVPNCTYREQVTIGKPLTLIGPARLEAQTRTYAFVIAASDVTIDGFTITGGAAAAQDGVVHAAGVNRFTFRNGSVTGALNGSCIDLDGGTGHRILDSEFGYCAQQGWHVHDFASDVLIARNHNHHNNPSHRYGFGGEAGGGKISRSVVNLSDNHVHHNLGPGIWCDPCYAGTVISGNNVHHNASAGIFFEIGVGGLISGNATWQNAWWGESEWGWGYGAGILVSSSRATEVSGNIAAWNQDGIVVLSQSRSDSPGNDGNNVHDNFVAMAPQPVAIGDQAFALGWLQDWSGGLFDASKNNRGSGNDYWHSQAEPTSCRFSWSGCHSTLSGFNATPGDEAGRYVTTAEKDSILAAAGVPIGP